MRRWLRILAVMAVTVAVTMKYGDRAVSPERALNCIWGGRTVQRGGRHTIGRVPNDRERLAQDGMTLRAFLMKRVQL